MIFTRLIIVFLSILSLKSFSQKDTLEAKVPLSFSYYGNTIVHKGFKVSGDWIWLEIEKTKINKNRKKIINTGLYTTPYFSFYQHFKSHAGFQIGLDLLWRQWNTRTWFQEIGIGLGYLKIYNFGETYFVSSHENEILNQKYQSRDYFAGSFSLAGGRTFKFQNNSSITPFLRLNMGLAFKYNTNFLLNSSLEIGCRFILYCNPKRGAYLKIKKIKEKK